MRFYLVLPLVVLITTWYSITSIIVALLDRSGRRYHRILRRWSRALLWLFGVRTTIRGAEKLDSSQNYVYLANHSSYLDIIALGATIPDQIRFVFKRELAKIPLFGWTLAVGPYILMDRTDPRNAMASIEHAATQIREGASVAIFPEGTRSHDGHLAPFKRGGFMLALRSGVPMVPVAIKGTWKLLNRNDRKVRPGTVEIVIGDPVSHSGNLTRPEETALQNRIHDQLQQMLE